MSNSIVQWVSKQNKKFSLLQRGRISSLEFLRNYEIATLLPWALFLLLILASLAVGGDANWQHIIGSFGTVVLAILSTALYIGAVLIGIFAAIQRFHDLGKSGWRTLLLLIPIANIVFGLMLLFKKGNSTDNQYGPVPIGVKRRWIPIGVVAILFLIGIVFLISAIVASNPITPFPFSLLL